MRLIALIATLAALALPAMAEQTLMGRSVVFSVLTYNEKDEPLFVGKRHDAVVGDGIEFGLVPEGVQNNLDVIPVLIDISAKRLTISFEASAEALLFDTEFNGYVLEFLTDCLLFQGAAIDAEATTLDMAPDAVFWDRGTLYINAAGFPVTPETRIAVDFEVADCVIS
ncbi:hypothetical protein IV417_11135 [Alphaproteobacteria bacterium KMM 3653]|uniref:Uncharacterized protein n=1 Tax=Harenicola maris TaxID=2841044 RepID=A0AAP2CR15_9RHOB|nr:hypothetical protein [Harenicola maris]